MLWLTFWNTDAMILNKSSYERGFGHASVYKTIKVDLADEILSAVSKGADKDKITLRNKMKRIRIYISYLFV